MFTGIIQGLGQITAIRRAGYESRFTIKPLFMLDSLQDGESIAVNGACLSVENHNGPIFTAYASQETMSRTNLGQLLTGDRANLERALAVGDRLGGHIVSGHVDCLATVTKIEHKGQSVFCRVSFPSTYATEIIAKGSVALNGISLTINDCGSDFLEVNIIPDSQKRTNFSGWRVGSQLNMETDLIGKYITNCLRLMEKSRDSDRNSGRLDSDFLARHGFV